MSKPREEVNDLEDKHSVDRGNAFFVFALILKQGDIRALLRESTGVRKSPCNICFVFVCLLIDIMFIQPENGNPINIFSESPRLYFFLGRLPQ